MAKAYLFADSWVRSNLLRWLQFVVVLGFAVLVIFNLGCFALHAAQMLRYPFPLDYGEGPLLAQVERLRSGVSVRDLYGPLDAPPFLVVNYPPVYLLVTELTSFLTGNVLLAGRLVSLMAALGCIAALLRLTADDRRPTTDKPASASRLLIVLAFLALPIVREWAVVMRVDLLGIVLGLSALVVVQRRAQRIDLVVAAALLCTSLFCKPSLLAAPCAAFGFVALRDWRRALELAGWLAVFSGAALALLVPGTHVLDHVVLANANPWQRDLAAGFWQGQAAIHWGLFGAGALGAVLIVRQAAGKWANIALPVTYTLVGAIGAIGVGKVGAYVNYFLELYVGLVWLAASGVRAGNTGAERQHMLSLPFSRVAVLPFASMASSILVATGLLWYYPTWSEQTVKLAGLVEGVNPPRLIIGRRGVWQDLRRERQILAVQTRTNRALIGDVQAAGAPILTDIPGVAAQAGQVARLQAFEHSQVLGQWDQRRLRLDLANGRVPLAVIDYLGNWLTPELISLIKHRYAQEGSRGGYDLYRPVDPGRFVAVEQAGVWGLQVRGYQLASQPLYAGEILPLTLVFARDLASQPPSEQPREIVLTLTDAQNRMVVRDIQPLFYGALQPRELDTETAQHMQPLRLPAIASGMYRLAVGLRQGQAITPMRDLATITVAAQTGALLPNGWLADGRTEYLPAPMLAAWRQFGGEQRFGKPLTPAVPFAGFTQQCFERGCLRLRQGQAEQAPVGEWLSVGDIGANGAIDQPAISQGFAPCYANFGGAVALGPAVTNEFRSGERLVQYTRFARLERQLASSACQLGAVGADVLRLPDGVPYRWP